jgi:hypothetical protein
VFVSWSEQQLTAGRGGRWRCWGATGRHRRGDPRDTARETGWIQRHSVSRWEESKSNGSVIQVYLLTRPHTHTDTHYTHIFSLLEVTSDVCQLS